MCVIVFCFSCYPPSNRTDSLNNRTAVIPNCELSSFCAWHFTLTDQLFHFSLFVCLLLRRELQSCGSKRTKPQMTSQNEIKSIVKIYNCVSNELFQVPNIRFIPIFVFYMHPHCLKNTHIKWNGGKYGFASAHAKMNGCQINTLLRCLLTQICWLTCC